MKATVRYYGYLQVLTGVTEEVIDEPAVGPSSTLADLLAAVVRRRPNLRDVCVIGSELDRNMLVFHNHERVPGRSLGEATVADGDAVDLVPPLGGGAG